MAPRSSGLSVGVTGDPAVFHTVPCAVTGLPPSESMVAPSTAAVCVMLTAVGVDKVGGVTPDCVVSLPVAGPGL